MKTILSGRCATIGFIGKVYTFVERVNDAQKSPAVELSSKYLGVMQDWWLVKADKLAWSESDIKFSGYASLEEMVSMLNGGVPDKEGQIKRIRAAIIFASGLTTDYTEFTWHSTVRNVKGIGKVISIVFGKPSLVETYKKTLEIPTTP
ncbi:MAG: hypothetical protein R3B53_00045 [Candidatus Paceibacterota bacterium]